MSLRIGGKEMPGPFSLGGQMYPQLQDPGQAADCSHARAFASRFSSSQPCLSVLTGIDKPNPHPSKNRGGKDLSFRAKLLRGKIHYTG